MFNLTVWWSRDHRRAGVHHQDIVDRAELAAHQYELRLSVTDTVVRRVVGLSVEVRTLENHVPGGSSLTEEVMLGGKLCVVDVVLGGVAEVLDGGEVGQSHV